MRLLGILRRVHNRLTRTVQQIPRRLLARPLLRGVAPRFFSNRICAPPSNRVLPHVLILRYRYYSQKNHALGDSTEKQMLEGTLTASRLATFDTLCWDTDFALSPFGDWRLLSECNKLRPDVIVLSSYSSKNNRQPCIETLQFLRRTYYIPIVAIVSRR